MRIEQKRKEREEVIVLLSRLLISYLFIYFKSVLQTSIDGHFVFYLFIYFFFLSILSEFTYNNFHRSFF